MIEQRILIVLAVCLAACGDDGMPADGSTGSASTTTPPTSSGSSSTTVTPPTTTPTPTTGDAEGSDSSSDGPPETSTTSGGGSTGEPVPVCNEVTPGGPSFLDTVWPLLDGGCSGGIGGVCHQNGSASAGLDMDMANAYDNLVCGMATEANLFRVNPGDPEASYWMHKLRGTHADVGGVGGHMPLGLTKFTKEELATAEAWIMGGANP